MSIFLAKNYHAFEFKDACQFNIGGQKVTTIKPIYMYLFKEDMYSY